MMSVQRVLRREGRWPPRLRGEGTAQVPLQTTDDVER